MARNSCMVCRGELRYILSNLAKSRSNGCKLIAEIDDVIDTINHKVRMAYEAGHIDSEIGRVRSDAISCEISGDAP